MCQPNAMLFIEFGDTRLTFALIIANIYLAEYCVSCSGLYQTSKSHFQPCNVIYPTEWCSLIVPFDVEKSAVAINKCKTAKGSFNRKKVLTRSPKQHRMPGAEFWMHTQSAL